MVDQGGRSSQRDCFCTISGCNVDFIFYITNKFYCTFCVVFIEVSCCISTKLTNQQKPPWIRRQRLHPLNVCYAFVDFECNLVL